MATSLESALHALITGLPNFAALKPVPPVRPYKLSQKDFKAGTSPLGVIIECPDEEHQVSLDGLGGGVISKASVTTVAEEFADCWNLAEIIRTNNTHPGTGISGFSGAVAGLTIQMITVDHTAKGFESYEDGSDEGFYYTKRTLSVDYTEAI